MLSQSRQPDRYFPTLLYSYYTKIKSSNIMTSWLAAHFLFSQLSFGWLQKKKKLWRIRYSWNYFFCARSAISCFVLSTADNEQGHIFATTCFCCHVLEWLRGSRNAYGVTVVVICQPDPLFIIAVWRGKFPRGLHSAQILYLNGIFLASNTFRRVSITLPLPPFRCSLCLCNNAVLFIIRELYTESRNFQHF